MLRLQRNRDNSSAKSTEFPFVHPQSLKEVAGIIHLTRTTFIFKHSTQCRVSLFAMKGLFVVDRVENERWVYIDVLAQRKLFLALAEELNVWHESPQLIMLVDGKVVAYGSHDMVNELTVKEC